MNLLQINKIAVLIGLIMFSCSGFKNAKQKIKIKEYFLHDDMLKSVLYGVIDHEKGCDYFSSDLIAYLDFFDEYGDFYLKIETINRKDIVLNK
ncbi:hypothetical protein [Litoribacter populi]|uniref:hypothetical protein n=1 Tax=Litoribacter populi TaxID=2598460 RepID=UPI00117E4C47|nr:hypothetical protein [Litoribacter populi]